MSPELMGKLQIRPGGRLVAFAPPPELAAEFLQEDADAAPVAGAIAFCLSPPDAALAQAVVARVQPGGLVWFAYRKGKVRQLAGLTRDVGWDAVNALGYQVVRSIAIDQTWTGLRFRHRDET